MRIRERNDVGNVSGSLFIFYLLLLGLYLRFFIVYFCF